MSRQRQTVWLLRSRQSPDPYEAALVEAGFEARSIAVLTFERIHTTELRSALEHPRSYGGLIFTSPRAVEAFADAMSWLPSENVVWHNKPVFAVGPRTASELREIGFSPEGEESGSATMLAEYVTGRQFKQPLLFLCGDRRLDELPDRLQKEGVSVEEIRVYRTVPRRGLHPEDEHRPDWLVFFSPSGVEALQSDDAIDASTVRIAAIGETTASSLLDHGYHVDAVASEPSPAGVTAAIQSVVDR